MVLGIVIGAVAVLAFFILTGKVSLNDISGGSNTPNPMEAELQRVKTEHMMLKNKYDNIVLQNEELNAKISSMRKRSNLDNEESDDLKDDLADSKKKVKRLNEKISQLEKEISDYKSACESYKMEINELKNR